MLLMSEAYSCCAALPFTSNSAQTVARAGEGVYRAMIYTLLIYVLRIPS